MNCSTRCRKFQHFDVETELLLEVEIEPKVVGEGKLLCSICDEIFTTYHGYVIHQLSTIHQYFLHRKWKESEVKENAAKCGEKT